MAGYRFAHLTDLHVAPLPPVRWRDLASRRVLGWLSWQKHRQRLHRRDVLDALAEDLRAQTPDHVVVTGDLVNLALPAEFEQGAAWLHELGAPSHVTFVPGNHDAYVPPRWIGGWAHLGPFMRGDGDSTPANRWVTFPFARRCGPVTFVGVSTAVPNPPTLATGRIGAAQLGRLRAVLTELRRPGCCRVVLLHHPPVNGMTSWRRRLTDADRFRAVLAEAGAELVLCGHQHRFQFAQLDGPEGPIPVVGGPSASLRTDVGDHYGGYLLHRLEPGERGWSLEIEGRRLDPVTGRARRDFLRRTARAPSGNRLILVEAGAQEPASV
jgi:3',5'-cyclic AMP phosphodiesterase CpdA